MATIIVAIILTCLVFFSLFCCYSACVQAGRLDQEEREMLREKYGEWPDW